MAAVVCVYFDVASICDLLLTMAGRFNSTVAAGCVNVDVVSMVLLTTDTFGEAARNRHKYFIANECVTPLL
jgi:hypothetical protein